MSFFPRVAGTAIMAHVVLAGALVGQDHDHRHPMKAPADSLPPMEMPHRPLGIPMSRMGSGTSWLPDASPMRAYHVMPGQWTFMVHGDLNLYYDYAGTTRGGDQAGSRNWFMLMAMRGIGQGMLHLHGMVSAEPLTVGARGYPLLLQTGEAYRGVPLHDRQHPHDLFMELSTMFEIPVSRGLAVSLSVAPVGEPGIGPVAYMHRPSAQNDLFAPLGHHWQDATHITFGVVTAGVFTRTVRLEGTLFHGREPDEHRYDFDFGPLDSYGGRLTVNPSPHWSAAASYGYLKSPEGLRPTERQRRLGASLLHTARLGQHGDWATALIYGANDHSTSGEPSSGYEHSLLVETNVQLDDRHSAFGRLEWTEKSAEELVVPDVPAETSFGIGTVVAGYVREVGAVGGATFGLGFRASLSVLPERLRSAYGTRTPAGFAVYGRFRPATLRRAHAGDRDEGPSSGP